ncbi:MAG: amidohydrolase [Anaerolineales bacterium]|nr:amidohydrolase [Anaerolineales bacterium]
MNKPIILKDAVVYRSAQSKPSKDWIVIHDGVIQAIFPEGEADVFDLNGEVLSLAGYTILPGLYDSHIHLLQYSQSLDYVNCDTKTLDECLQRIKQKADSTEPGSWIIGHGWDQNLWTRSGTKEDLDIISMQHPIFLTSRSLHSAWINSYAFRLAGIDQSTTDPDGGVIVRSCSGELTGILLEKATALISDIIPAPDPHNAAELIQRGQQELWQFGLVGVHNFDRQLSFRSLQILQQRGDLGLRVLQSIPLEALPSAQEVGLRQGFGNDWLKIGSVKLFMDGALGPHTAAMNAPYENEPNNTGVLLMDEEQLIEILKQSHSAALPLAIHAIGDLANHTALNAIQKARSMHKEGLSPYLTHRIEHAQLLNENDYARFQTLNITASMQPVHATSDMHMAQQNWGQRSKNSYAWRSLLNAGAELLFGSDAPVESPNPFLGIHAAVTRRRADGSPDTNGWIPEQCLEIAEAIHAYTRVPARYFHSNRLWGTLEPFSAADLVVLKQDPYKVQAHSIKDITPAGTMVAGQWRFRTF